CLSFLHAVLLNHMSLPTRRSSDFDNDDVEVDINKTVVMINISDKLLFNTGSYRVSEKASSILGKLAEVINSEPSMEVMVEGHTRSEEHTSELQSRENIVCRLLLEK